MDSQTIVTFGSEIVCSDVTKNVNSSNIFSSIFLKFCQKMVHSIFDSFPKFGAAAQRQTGVITRRKKWGRLKGKSQLFTKFDIFIEAAHAVKSVQTLFEISL